MCCWGEGGDGSGGGGEGGGDGSGDSGGGDGGRSQSSNCPALEQGLNSLRRILWTLSLTLHTLAV